MKKRLIRDFSGEWGSCWGGECLRKLEVLRESASQSEIAHYLLPNANPTYAVIHPDYSVSISC